MANDSARKKPPTGVRVTVADRRAAVEALGIHHFQWHDVELWVLLNEELPCHVMREEHCVRLYRVAHAIAEARSEGVRAARERPGRKRPRSR